MADAAPAFQSWTSHGWGIEVKTPRQLFDLISHISLLAQDRTYAWRGQNDASWQFSSSLFRRIASLERIVSESKLRNAEKEILCEARRWGLGRDLGPSATDMHMLAVLQHHGVPTRLIDVTANPMTALWFATEEHPPDREGSVRRSSGVLFAIDVTGTEWYETFEHGRSSYNSTRSPLSSLYKEALNKSRTSGKMFRAFPALPDERMKAQEGFFLGATVPAKHSIPGVLGLNPQGPAPGEEKLEKLLQSARGRGRPARVPFCAIVIPANVKDKVRAPLKRTYNRRRRVLFPDVDGFREAFIRGQLD